MNTNTPRRSAMATIGIAVTLALTGAAASAAQQHESDDARAAREDAEAAVDEAMKDIEKAAEEDRRFEQRLEVCKVAIASDDLWSYVDRQIASKPDLGPKVEHYRVCMAYLTGKRDGIAAALEL